MSYDIVAGQLRASIQCHIMQLPNFEKLHRQVMQSVGCHRFTVVHEEPRTADGQCGFRAVHFLAFAVGDAWDQPQYSDPVVLKQKFREYIEVQTKVGPPCMLAAGRGFGAQTKQEASQALQVELAKHGVFPERVAERTAHVINALGTDAVLRALQAHNPWSALKQQCDQVKPSVRLVLPDELQLQIERRASKGKPVGMKQPPKPPKLSSTLREQNRPVLHDQVEIRSQVFQEHEGQFVQQIQIHAVHANACGVIITDQATAEPYATAGKLISAKGLALLVVPPVKFSGCQLHAEEIRFLANCLATGEPTLITATLLQLGQVKIVKHAHRVQCEAPEVPNGILKCCLYRDECVLDWNVVCERPIRAVMDVAAPLQECTRDSCDCQRWHPIQHPEVQQVLLDVWRRQFCGDNYVTVPPKDATMFTVHIRVPKLVQDAALAVSGVAGLYFEPRTHDGTKPSEQHWCHLVAQDHAARGTQACASHQDCRKCCQAWSKAGSPSRSCTG